MIHSVGPRFFSHTNSANGQTVYHLDCLSPASQWPLGSHIYTTVHEKPK